MLGGRYGVIKFNSCSMLDHAGEKLMSAAAKDDGDLPCC